MGDENPSEDGNPNDDEDVHHPFNITNIDHHGGNAEFRPEKSKCDLKSIPAPMHGRWLCDNENKKKAGSCVLKCDKGYKTPNTVTVRCGMSGDWCTSSPWIGCTSKKDGCSVGKSGDGNKEDGNKEDGSGTGNKGKGNGDGYNNDGDNEDRNNDDGDNDDGGNDGKGNGDGNNEDGDNEDGDNEDGDNEDGDNDDRDNDDGDNDDGDNDDGDNDDGGKDGEEDEEVVNKGEDKD